MALSNNMNITEIILILTVLVETFLLAILLWRDRTRRAEFAADALPHFVARSSKYPKSRQNNSGTWVID